MRPALAVRFRASFAKDGNILSTNKKTAEKSAGAIASFAFSTNIPLCLRRIFTKGFNMSDADNQALVAQILSAYLSKNTVAPGDLATVIETVKRSFFGGEVSSALAGPVSEEKKWEPAVPVKKSVTPDSVTCLCCGKKFKSLKRHLNTEHGLTPEQYREAFGLKKEHPIVAPNYAEQRSTLAKTLGLGRKVKKAVAPAKKAPGGKASPKKAAE